MYKKGDLILPIEKVKKENLLSGLFHPAVVWDDKYDGSNDFTGIMLSSKGPENGYADNIPMQKSHFEEGHEKGYYNSHFVNQVFLKFETWGPFKLVGRLTPEGVEFIEMHLTNKNLKESHALPDLSERSGARQ